jgi:hypothetical protein
MKTNTVSKKEEIITAIALLDFDDQQDIYKQVFVMIREQRNQQDLAQGLTLKIGQLVRFDAKTRGIQYLRIEKFGRDRTTVKGYPCDCHGNRLSYAQRWTVSNSSCTVVEVAPAPEPTKKAAAGAAQLELFAEELPLAAEALGEMTGTVSTDDLAARPSLTLSKGNETMTISLEDQAAIDEYERYCAAAKAQASAPPAALPRVCAPVMTAKAQGTPYSAFVALGCTDDMLREHGYMI